MSTIREILGNGTWLGFPGHARGFVTIGIMTQAPGAFLCFGLLKGLCVWVEGKLDARIERKIGCQPMKDLQEGEDNKLIVKLAAIFFSMILVTTTCW